MKWTKTRIPDTFFSQRLEFGFWKQRKDAGKDVVKIVSYTKVRFFISLHEAVNSNYYIKYCYNDYIAMTHIPLAL